MPSKKLGMRNELETVLVMNVRVHWNYS